MKKIPLLLSVTILIGCSTSASHEIWMPVNLNTSHNDANVPVKQAQSLSKAADLIEKLPSSNEAERERAKKKIKSLARESAVSREQVIQELIKFVNQSDARLRSLSAAHYDAWSFAVELLGKLKATEAIDTLVACIICNDGIEGTSSYRHPAFRAVTMIGPAAIPKLTEALSNSDSETRKYSAIALGEIGGTEARAALENALLSEQNEEVRRIIRIALRMK
jgi:HEAT repeat protein